MMWVLGMCGFVQNFARMTTEFEAWMDDCARVINQTPPATDLAAAQVHTCERESGHHPVVLRGNVGGLVACVMLPLSNSG